MYNNIKIYIYAYIKLINNYVMIHNQENILACLLPANLCSESLFISDIGPNNDLNILNQNMLCSLQIYKGAQRVSKQVTACRHSSTPFTPVRAH